MEKERGTNLAKFGDQVDVVGHLWRCLGLVPQEGEPALSKPNATAVQMFVVLSDATRSGDMATQPPAGKSIKGAQLARHWKLGAGGGLNVDH